MSVEAALQQMLKDTDFQINRGEDGVIFITAKKNRVAVVSDESSNAAKPVSSKREVEEMIITMRELGKRTEPGQDPQDLPISISAFTSEEIQERRFDDFKGLGMAVPGMSVSDQGAYRKIFLRGIGNNYGWTASLVGIYVDNVSVSTNPSFALDLRLYDLDRIEVFRGPQGTLYGDTSVGGTIRFVSKDPELNEFNGQMDMSVSFTEHGEAGQKLQGVVNIPVIDDEIALRVSATLEREGGWIDQPALGLENINGQSIKNIRVKGLWAPNESLKLIASAIAHHNDGAINAGEDSDGNFTQAFEHPSTPDLLDKYEIYDLSVTYDFDTFNFLSATNYIDAYRQSSWEGGARPLFPPPTPLVHKLDSEYLVSTRVFSEELRFSSRDSETWNWSTGLFYRDRTVNQNSFAHYGFSDGSGVLPPAAIFIDRQNTKSLALFGEVNYPLTDHLKVGLGARYFDDHRTYSDGIAPQKGSFRSVNPRFFVNLDVTDTVMTYINVAKGFRSGGFNTFDQPGFGPETVWSYELGTKTSFLDGRFEAEMALFFSQYNNYQIARILPLPTPPFGISDNAGDAEVRGVDWSLSWNVTENLNVHFIGNVIDTEVVEITNPLATHKVGDSLDLVFDHSITLATSYDFELGEKPARVRVDYSRRGKAPLRNRQIGDFYYSESDVIDILNASIEWRWNNCFSFGVFAKNLLGEHGHTDPFAIINFSARPRPRTFGVKIGMNF